MAYNPCFYESSLSYAAGGSKCFFNKNFIILLCFSPIFDMIYIALVEPAHNKLEGKPMHIPDEMRVKSGPMSGELPLFCNDCSIPAYGMGVSQSSKSGYAGKERKWQKNATSSWGSQAVPRQ